MRGSRTTSHFGRAEHHQILVNQAVTVRIQTDHGARGQVVVTGRAVINPMRARTAVVAFGTVLARVVNAVAVAVTQTGGTRTARRAVRTDTITGRQIQATTVVEAACFRIRRRVHPAVMSAHGGIRIHKALRTGSLVLTFRIAQGRTEPGTKCFVNANPPRVRS